MKHNHKFNKNGQCVCGALMPSLAKEKQCEMPDCKLFKIMHNHAHPNCSYGDPKPMKIDEKLKKIITRKDDCKDQMETCHFNEKTVDEIKQLFTSLLSDLIGQEEYYNGVTAQYVQDERNKLRSEIRNRAKERGIDLKEG